MCIGTFGVFHFSFYGPIICKLCDWENKDAPYDEFQLENRAAPYDEFQRLFSHFQCFFALPVHYLSDGFKARLESFWS